MKYKVEAVLPVTYTHTFEVEAESEQEAIEKAQIMSTNFNFKDGSESHGEYDLHVLKSETLSQMVGMSNNTVGVSASDLEKLEEIFPATMAFIQKHEEGFLEGDECLDCGGVLIMVGNRVECPSCGTFY